MDNWVEMIRIILVNAVDEQFRHCILTHFQWGSRRSRKIVREKNRQLKNVSSLPNSPLPYPNIGQWFPFFIVMICFVIFQCYAVFHFSLIEIISITANGEGNIALQRQAYMYCLIAMLTRLKILKSADSGMPRIISVSEKRTIMPDRFCVNSCTWSHMILL